MLTESYNKERQWHHYTGIYLPETGLSSLFRSVYPKASNKAPSQDRDKSPTSGRAVNVNVLPLSESPLVFCTARWALLGHASGCGDHYRWRRKHEGRGSSTVRAQGHGQPELGVTSLPHRDKGRGACGAAMARSGPVLSRELWEAGGSALLLNSSWCN